MISRRTRNVLILALSVYALMGIFFFFYLKEAQNDFSEEITVEVNGATRTVLEISELDLMPGETREYVVNIKSRAEGEYTIDLGFEEIIGGELKNFILAEISGGDKTYVKSLGELFGGEEKITFKCLLKADEATRISIRYNMPTEVGNEAQGAAADFNVVLTAASAEFNRGRE